MPARKKAKPKAQHRFGRLRTPRNVRIVDGGVVDGSDERRESSCSRCSKALDAKEEG